MSRSSGSRRSSGSFARAVASYGSCADIDLNVTRGEIIALVGPSGSGKSTLLHIAGLLERPDAGEVYLDGDACGGLNDEQRTLLRRLHFGFVYQYHHLLPEFSAVENVTLPQLIAGKSPAQARRALARTADAAWPRGTGDASARPAFRRRATAGRHRPGAGQPAEGGAGRRADRQPRPGHRRRRYSRCC